jgi:hypothetical protein
MDTKNIVRKERTARDPYTRILREVLEDGFISLAAKGLLCYILAKPDTWEVRVGELAANAGIRKSWAKVEGKTMPAPGWLPLSTRYVYRLLAELAAARYVWCEWRALRGTGGRWESDSVWHVYEDKETCTADLYAYNAKKTRKARIPCKSPGDTGVNRLSPASINTGIVNGVARA